MIFLYLLKSLKCAQKMSNIMLEMSIYNYWLLNIIGKISENDMGLIDNVNIIIWEMSKKRVNENHYTERHSNG